MRERDSRDVTAGASCLPEITNLQSMPDRILLRFPPVTEKIGAIHIPDSRRLRPELGELVSIGEGLSEETKILRAQILERARAGHKFLVPISSGTYYYREEMGEEFAFLKDVRSYRITEIATSLAP